MHTCGAWSCRTSTVHGHCTTLDEGIRWHSTLTRCPAARHPLQLISLPETTGVCLQGEPWQGNSWASHFHISLFSLFSLCILLGFIGATFFLWVPVSWGAAAPPRPKTKANTSTPHTPRSAMAAKASETGANLSKIRDPFAAVFVPFFFFFLFAFVIPFHPGFSSFFHPSGITNCHSFSLVLSWKHFGGGFCTAEQ